MGRPPARRRPQWHRHLSRRSGSSRQTRRTSLSGDLTPLNVFGPSAQREVVTIGEGHDLPPCESCSTRGPSRSSKTRRTYGLTSRGTARLSLSDEFARLRFGTKQHELGERRGVITEPRAKWAPHVPAGSSCSRELVGLVGGGEIEARGHVEVDLAIRDDVHPEQWRQAAPVRRRQQLGPRGLATVVDGAGRRVDGLSRRPISALAAGDSVLTSTPSCAASATADRRRSPARA